MNAANLISLTLEVSRIQGLKLHWKEAVERICRRTVALSGARSLEVSLRRDDSAEPFHFVTNSRRPGDARLERAVPGGERRIGSLTLTCACEPPSEDLSSFLDYLAQQIAGVAERGWLDEDVRALQAGIELMNREIDGRKVIDRARGILAQERGLSDGAAFNLLRKQSLSSGKGLAEVAGAIVTLHTSRLKYIPARLRIKRTA